MSDPGNNLATAFDLGLLTGSTSRSDAVDSLDPNDFYRFTLSQNSRVDVTLSGLFDSARVELIADIDNDGVIDLGETIQADVGRSGDNAFINPDLTAGTYYVRVAPYLGGDSTNYTLNLNPTATPPTTSFNPGNTLGTALNIGTVSSPKSYFDNVGPLDLVDFYRFSVTQNSQINFSLSGLTDRTRLELIADLDNDGVIDSGETLQTDLGGQGDNAVLVRNVTAGTYYVRVAPYLGGDSSNYSLDLFATTNSPSSLADYLIGTIANETINLLAGNDRMDGRAGNDSINGSSGNDTLNGEEGNDTLLGGAGNDFLVGDLDNDLLQGGRGRDTLTGGFGQDNFQFTSLNDRVDTITDFIAADDTILVSAAQFGGGLVAGSAISSAQFVLGSVALDANDRFIYNQSTGALFFDVDGTGSTAQIQIATLSSKPAISRLDIVGY